jgi:hypothetical protein
VDRTERTTFTTMFIRDAMDGIAKLYFFDADRWPGFPTEDTEHKPLGFTPPLLLEGTFFIFVSPAVIIDVSSHLDDDAFVDFLCWVKVHLHLHITHYDLPAADQEIRVEAELFALSPSSDATASMIRERVRG